MNNQREQKECNIWKFITEELLVSDIDFKLQENMLQ